MYYNEYIWRIKNIKEYNISIFRKNNKIYGRFRNFRKKLFFKLENKILFIKEMEWKLENTIDKLDNELILNNIEYYKNQTLESIKNTKNIENCINNILLDYKKISERATEINIVVLISLIITVLATLSIFEINSYLYKKEKDNNDINYSEIKRIQNQTDDIYYLNLSDNKFIEQKNKENKAKIKNKFFICANIRQDKKFQISCRKFKVKLIYITTTNQSN